MNGRESWEKLKCAYSRVTAIAVFFVDKEESHLVTLNELISLVASSEEGWKLFHSSSFNSSHHRSSSSNYRKLLCMYISTHKEWWSGVEQRANVNFVMRFLPLPCSHSLTNKSRVKKILFYSDFFGCKKEIMRKSCENLGWRLKKNINRQRSKKIILWG